MNIIQQATYNSDQVKIQSRESLFRGFIQVEKVNLKHRLFDQTEFTSVIQRELVHRPEAAGVLIYNDRQQKFALIEQFRVGAMDDVDSPWQLEIIAGVLDGDESPESCIRRESLEESGCEIDQLQHLFSFYPLLVLVPNCSIYIAHKPNFLKKGAYLACPMKGKIFSYI